jgi:protein gp37
MTTSIEWTDETWNPLVGCSKISAGCQNCYAIGQAHRNAAIAKTHPNPGRLAYYEGLTEKRGDRLEWTGQVNFIPDALSIPIGWKKPRRIFVNSMSDMFHESVPFEWIDQIFAVMALTPQHTYQILTKRPDRMLEYCRSAKNRIRIAAVDMGRICGIAHDRFEQCDFEWPLPNIWLGVTVENQRAADERIPLLLQTPAALRFLSCEPLLEEVSIENISGWHESFTADYRSQINWVIVGGESGHGARSTQISHIDSIVSQCQYAKVPVFVKQLGAKPVTGCGDSWPISDRKGAIVSEWPEHLRIQEFPETAQSPQDRWAETFCQPHATP